MVQVNVRSHEPVERAINRFRKKVEKAGLLNDIKKNAYYEKPSVQKRLRRAKAIKMLNRRLARQARASR
jgi:small subunit ribosomal protein S21